MLGFSSDVGGGQAEDAVANALAIFHGEHAAHSEPMATSGSTWEARRDGR